MIERLTRAGLLDISVRLDRSERLDLSDGIRLFEADLLTVGWLANRERERRHGARAYYNYNIRLEATNVAQNQNTTDAGLFARYQEASTQMVLGNTAEAAKAYQQVIDHGGDKLYGQMARLGLAEAHARSGQYEQAITAYKELVQRKDGQLPIDGILIQLGRVYRDAGRANDAQQTFNRVVEEFPDSPFNADAKRELDALKKTPSA